MTYLYLAIGIVIGIVLGIIFSSVRECHGILRIDRSDEKDLYRFEIDNLDILKNKKSITLKIDNNANIREKNM